MISFCTTCMGRLHHLKQTLEANIKATEGFEREFIILDYNSQDGLQEWIAGFGSPVVYYKLVDPLPKYYVSTHAKNLAHKCGRHNLLCNLDCDVYLVPGYLEFIAETFEKNPLSIICGATHDRNGEIGCNGRIVVRLDHFYSVNGYDEDVKIGWGCDDTNFQYRTRMHNGLQLVDPPKEFNLVVSHSNDERVEHFENKNIHYTNNLSWQRLYEISVAKNYVANQNRPWGAGTILDCKSGEALHL